MKMPGSIIAEGVQYSQATDSRGSGERQAISSERPSRHLALTRYLKDGASIMSDVVIPTGEAVDYRRENLERVRREVQDIKLGTDAIGKVVVLNQQNPHPGEERTVRMFHSGHGSNIAHKSTQFELMDFALRNPSDLVVAPQLPEVIPGRIRAEMAYFGCYLSLGELAYRGSRGHFTDDVTRMKVGGNSRGGLVGAGVVLSSELPVDEFLLSDSPGSGLSYVGTLAAVVKERQHAKEMAAVHEGFDPALEALLLDEPAKVRRNFKDWCQRVGYHVDSLAIDPWALSRPSLHKHLNIAAARMNDQRVGGELVYLSPSGSEYNSVDTIAKIMQSVAKTGTTAIHGVFAGTHTYAEHAKGDYTYFMSAGFRQ